MEAWCSGAHYTPNNKYSLAFSSDMNSNGFKSLKAKSNETNRTQTNTSIVNIRRTYVNLWTDIIKIAILMDDGMIGFSIVDTRSAQVHINTIAGSKQ